MKLQTIALTIALLTSSCAAATSAPPTTSVPETTASPIPAALVELATKDHTFGTGASPFKMHLILDHLDPTAGADQTSEATRQLTVAERSAVQTAFLEVGETQWIQDSKDWISDDLRPVLDESVILGVGEPRFEGSTAFVPVSLWCGGLCGTWFTYELELVDGDWQVVGIDGAVAIS